MECVVTSRSSRQSSRTHSAQFSSAETFGRIDSIEMWRRTHVSSTWTTTSRRAISPSQVSPLPWFHPDIPSALKDIWGKSHSSYVLHAIAVSVAELLPSPLVGPHVCESGHQATCPLPFGISLSGHRGSLRVGGGDVFPLSCRCFSTSQTTSRHCVRCGY